MTDQPLSKTHPTLWAASPPFRYSRFAFAEAELVQSCTVDVTEHEALRDICNDKQFELENLFAQLVNEQAEHERVKKELEKYHNTNTFKLGMEEGERRAMERLFEQLDSEHSVIKYGSVLVVVCNKHCCDKSDTVIYDKEGKK